jgi:hypothetical protein
VTDLEKKILDAIAEQKLAPKPVYQFLAKRSVFWVLAGISILFGAINFAVIQFVISDYFATGWRVLDNIHYNEALIGIPVLWFILAGLFATSAAYGLRHTKRGYRISSSHLAGGAVLASLLLGIILHATDTGRNLHTSLAENYDSYRTSTYVPFDEWSRPERGKLGGTVLEDLGNGLFKLRDFKDKIWTVDVSDASIKLDNAILDEGDIAITGQQTGSDTFRALMIDEFD